MWELVNDFPPPPAAKGLTVSMWRYENAVVVGVMRAIMLAPPFLWAEKLPQARKLYRKGGQLLSMLQEQLYAPTVHAEVEHEFPRNKELLKLFGFVETISFPDRTLFTRSL